MKKLFIADDEDSIREGLKCIIDWEKLGFRLCGEAANGKDALSRILAKNPDLVLLDVKMPGLHGTEVIRLARESGFQGKCIILSGYSDFKYAQEAIKNGVRFYLTKPIDEDELIETVTKIREEIMEERQRASHFTQYRNRAKNVVLQELLHNTLSEPLTEEDCHTFQLTADVYQVVICESFHAQTAAAPYSFAELLKVANRDNQIFEHLQADHKDIVILKGAHGLQKLTSFLEHYEQQKPQDGSPMDSLFLAYGRPVCSVTELYLSYRDAFALSGRRFFCSPDQHTAGYELLPAADQSASDGGTPAVLFDLSSETLSDFTARFSDYISAYNRDKITAALKELNAGCIRLPNEISEIRLFLTDLYLQIKETLNHSYASLNLPFLGNSEAIEYINSRNYLYEIIRFLSEQFEEIMGAMGGSSKDAVLNDVLFYIDHNFKNNLKLEAIASLFGYNSAYLGKIFTKWVGESFNSYVDHKRIDYSKQLLLENKLKVYEIAEQAGYKNVDYFHKKFKKYVGISPVEFRKKNGLEDGAEFTPPPEKS